jgi:ubiquinone/menaquinone biosynthesis C-methylase UbiE
MLDVATGPGTLPRIAAGRLGPTGRLVGTDISAVMLAVARQKPELAGGAPIEYIEAPAAPLPVASGSFDVVTCQQGLQFFPDRSAALKEMHRALKPGGRLAVAVWSSVNRQPYFAAVYAVLTEALSAEKAGPYAAPFQWPSADQLKAALERASFKGVRVEERRLPLIFEGGVDQALSALAASPLATTIAEMAEKDRRRLYELAAERIEPLKTKEGVRTEMVSNIATALK